MAFDKAKDHIAALGLEDRIMEFEVSSATVELAAVAVGTLPERIAKSLTFMVGERPIMIVCAGDGRISNKKFKAAFSCKAKMMSPQQVSEYTGHEIGGVCPFGINPGTEVYLDLGLKRFDTVYPACGSSNSAVRLSLQELEMASNPKGWVDVCQDPQEAGQ